MGRRRRRKEPTIVHFDYGNQEFEVTSDVYDLRKLLDMLENKTKSREQMTVDDIEELLISDDPQQAERFVQVFNASASAPQGKLLVQLHSNDNGFGTRLQKDIIEYSRLNGQCSKYDHLLSLPKALLPVGKFDSLLSYWLDVLLCSNDGSPVVSTEDIFVITNSLYYQQFLAWALNKGVPTRNVYSNGVQSNSERLGAVRDLQIGLQHFNLVSNNIVVIAGDTIFKLDEFNKFNMGQVLAEFGANDSLDVYLTYYKCPLEECLSVGVLQVDPKTQMVLKFREKPQQVEAGQNNACPCFYVFKPSATKELQVYLNSVEQQDFKLRDSMGSFIAYLVNSCSQVQVKGLQLDGRLEVGGLSSYLKTSEAVCKQLQ
ncbi:hypothetical protein MIR68_011613 [Amoeboaphelidium protococcarum]|nr:hypothetical protein MIR68_011613 [Amoeboaphelidium protococcarum]